MSEIQKFTDLNLIPPLARAVADKGYKVPTPIQALAIPHLLKGRDLLGCAQTGTGKTAAFALPVLQALEKSGGKKRRIRALVMTPTRELAAQIHESFQTYSRHLRINSTVIFGGVKQGKQEKALKRGPDILIATPGRLIDLMNQRIVNLKYLEHFILDEADRMLDMGFIHDVRKVIDALPDKRQSLFFSATMPPAVAKLADRMLTNPVKIEVAPQSTMAERIEQSLKYVDKCDKRKLLEIMLKTDKSIYRALVFSRTKHGVDRICKQLAAKDIDASAIHGNKSQNARTRALANFRAGKTQVLVATDIAARGIDVEGITHVINFDLPNEPESYVHRVGRTARAGNAGRAISFCSGGEIPYLHEIEKLIKHKIPVDIYHAYHSDDAKNGFEDGRLAETPCRQQTKQRMARDQARQNRKSSKPTNRNPKRHSENSKGKSDSSHPHVRKSAKTRSKRRQKPR